VPGSAIRSVLSGSGFIDPEITAFNLFLVQSLDGSIGFIGVRHLHKAEAFGTSGELVHDDTGTGDITEVCEEVSQLVIVDTPGQVSYVDIHRQLSTLANNIVISLHNL
jgi:UPF0288 family protein (methanogenesis marker protein 3)